MGAFSFGLFVVVVGSWLWFWTVTGLAVARARGGHAAVGAALCVLLGPVGLLIVVLTTLQPATPEGPRPF